MIDSDLLELVEGALLAASGAPGGIRARLAVFTEVALVEHRGDLVQTCGPRLLVSRRFSRLFSALPPEDQTIASALAIVHEALHIVQGMGRKRTVEHLRCADGEATLMRIDLSADVAAALLLAQFLKIPPASTLAIASKSLRAFPVRSLHTPASRRRKARRAVSLKATEIVHRLGLTSLLVDIEDFLVADFQTPAPSLLLSAHRLPTIVGIARLELRDVLTLESAADSADTERDSEVERVLVLALTETIESKAKPPVRARSELVTFHRPTEVAPVRVDRTRAIGQHVQAPPTAVRRS